MITQQFYYECLQRCWFSCCRAVPNICFYTSNTIMVHVNMVLHVFTLFAEMLL